MKKNNKIKIETIIKYIFSAGTSFLLDLGLFTIFILIFGNSMKGIFISTILARIMSSLYNYMINSRFVFKNSGSKQIIKYYLLVIIQLMVSALLVSIINKYIKVFTTIIKLFVDVTIFIVNYYVQKEIVFK